MKATFKNVKDVMVDALNNTAEKHPLFNKFVNKATYFKSLPSILLSHRYNAIVKEKYALGNSIHLELPPVYNNHLTAITTISQAMGKKLGEQKISFNVMTWKTAYARRGEHFYIKTPLVNLRFSLISHNLIEVSFYATRKAYAANKLSRGIFFKALSVKLGEIANEISPKATSLLARA